MPREVPKSWDYAHHAWDTCARTPVASAIESVTGGDEKLVTFNLFGDGSKKKARKKKKNKKKNCLAVQLILPENLDMQVSKVAALVDHFNSNYGTPKLYGEAVTYQAPKKQVPTSSVSPDNPPGNVSMLKQQLRQNGILDSEMIRFIVDLSRLVGHKRSVHVLVNQWRNVIKTCTSHWYALPLWWCVGSTLVGDNVLGMTRQHEGVVNPATCLENWDMQTLLKLIECAVFPDKANKAAGKVLQYTRHDLAHERFDCDWLRDWSCMAELLDALECSSAADGLRNFCESKTHNITEGDTCRSCAYHYTHLIYARNYNNVLMLMVID